MTVTIRAATDRDMPWVLNQNNEAAPAVNALSMDQLSQLVSKTSAFRIAEIDGRPVGFLLAMTEGADYGSMNFQWFKAHYDQFVYIDRVVIAASSRRLGVGRVLYADIHSYTERTAPVLTCEVNLHPPNPGSVRFHSVYGFREVGQQDTEGGAKRVSLLALEVPEYAYVSGREAPQS
ncbi:MAG: GNAT family N-acetyltransferase [Pseudomonadota bacterium]